eukprot:GEMP01023891.1.p1 GENE.GEMP01023891.1~~GEMP01023891.1.p1  ORF type:complete len:151 (+),score=18.53 GEMP01023891.1:66-518(+)
MSAGSSAAATAAVGSTRVPQRTNRPVTADKPGSHRHLECPECRTVHRTRCGKVVYLRAQCSICLEARSPFVLLPCAHGLCVADFETLGGRILATTKPTEHLPVVLERQQQTARGPEIKGSQSWVTIGPIEIIFISVIVLVIILSVVVSIR